MANCQAIVPNFEFTEAQIKEAVKNNRLLSMEIEFSLRCNFHCQYCYIPDKSSFDNELSFEELSDCLLQAKALGVKKIIVLGGEPMLYPQVLKMLKFIRAENLDVEMFTNGFGITLEMAKELLDLGVLVVLKMNSRKEDVQDALAGKKGAYKIIQDAFNNLRRAGFPAKTKRLGVSTIVCQQNFEEIISMWEWLRQQEIQPYFEIITPQGKGRQNEWLHVDSQKLKETFFKIAQIDRKKYGIQWDPQPPLIGIKCLRHQFSCLLNSQGYILPCVGINIPLGNIRQRRLADIIKESEVIQDLRNYQANIKGPCRQCDKTDSCYGCRGAAYQMTGDYLASDPLCWNNIEHQSEIVHLPAAVNRFIPQQPPMQVIDTLVSIGERTANINVTISNDMLFVRDDGTLDETAYLELIAQSIAAQAGFKQVGVTSQAVEGFLLGARNLEIYASARIGDILAISIEKYARFGDFGIFKGRIFRGEDLLAQGEVKVWEDKKKL
ncbi:MAG: radical SAM protein [Candidatus Omnitrophica bacterium]|nr:radical SAM protein [Candidatus Omnitrophota bacterium]